MCFYEKVFYYRLIMMTMSKNVLAYDIVTSMAVVRYVTEEQGIEEDFLMCTSLEGRTTAMDIKVEVMPCSRLMAYPGCILARFAWIVL